MSASDRQAELALCRACASGDARALATLERDYFSQIDRALQHLDRDGDLIDEVKQRLRSKLLVADTDGSPSIARFSGSGPLGRWLQVVATREALTYLRSTMRARAREANAADAAPRDAEIALLRREYRADFERAFADALATLSSRDRNILYYNLVAQLGLDQIGRIYRVHRATAFRWMRDARERLVAKTRELLAARMQLERDELEQLLRLVESRASVSVERLLRQARSTAT